MALRGQGGLRDDRERRELALVQHVVSHLGDDQSGHSLKDFKEYVLDAAVAQVEDCMRDDGLLGAYRAARLLHDKLRDSKVLTDADDPSFVERVLRRLEVMPKAPTGPAYVAGAHNWELFEAAVRRFCVEAARAQMEIVCHDASHGQLLLLGEAGTLRFAHFAILGDRPVMLYAGTEKGRESTSRFLGTCSAADAFARVERVVRDGASGATGRLSRVAWTDGVCEQPSVLFEWPFE